MSSQTAAADGAAGDVPLQTSHPPQAPPQP
jgi:hypothetical protein